MARTPIHPGEHLAEQLKALDMSASALARRLAVPTNRVTAIIKGSARSPGTPHFDSVTSSGTVRSSG